MNGEEFIKAIKSLYAKASESLEAMEKDFIACLAITRRHIQDDTDIRELRSELQNIFHMQTQHYINILAREINTAITESTNNPHRNFDPQYDNIVRVVLKFYKITEAKRDESLSQYNLYHERYYPNAPIFIPKKAAETTDAEVKDVEGAEVASAQYIESHVQSPNLFNIESTAPVGFSCIDVDVRIEMIRSQLTQENAILAEQVKEWIKSHYPIRKQDIFFSLCFKLKIDLDKRIERDLSKLQAVAREGCAAQEFEEKLTIVLKFIQDARRNVFQTLKTSPDSLHLISYEDEGVTHEFLEDDFLIANHALDIAINVTAPSALYGDQAVLALITEIGEVFSPELYNLLASNMYSL